MEIQNISPAQSGWRAVFVGEDQELRVRDVACWGTAEVVLPKHNYAKSKIPIGLVAMTGNPELVICEDFMDFLGYLAPGEPLDIYLPVLEEFLEDVRENASDPQTPEKPN